MKRVFESLRSRLIALILVAMLPMLTIAWFIGAQLYHHAVDDAYRETKILVQGISLQQEEHINTARELLFSLSASPLIIERRQEACSVFKDALAKHAIFANVGMTDVEGNAICMGAPKTHEGSFSDRLWFRQIRQGHDEIVVGDYHLGVLIKEPVVIVAKPVKGRHGEHLAYLFVSVDLSWFDRNNLGNKLPKGAEVIFYDHNGVILHSEPEPEIWRGKPIGAAIRRIGAPDPATGVTEAYAMDGISRLFSFAKLESSSASENAFVAVGIPTDTALAQVRRTGGLAVLVVLGVFGGMLLFAWVGTGRLAIAQVRRLIHQANAHAAGDLAQRSGVADGTELSELAHALDGMAVKLAAHEHELRLHLHAFNAHAIVSAADTAGNIVYANDKFCEISQYAREEVIGKTHQLINSGFHPPEFFSTLWGTISQGEIWHGNIRNRRKDGSYYWVASTIVPFVDDNGQLERYFSIRTDITRALAIDEALQKSEERFRLLAKNALDVISLHDPDGRYSYVSPSCERVLGYAPADLTGHDGYELVHPDDVERVRGMLHQPALLGEPGECGYVRVRHRNGGYIWVDATAAPTRDEAGNIVSIQVSVRDVTGRKAAEDTLRLHDRAIAASGSGIVIFRRGDLGIEYANAAYSDIVELPEADLPGQRWPALAEAAGSLGAWQFLRDAVISGEEMHAVVEGLSRHGRNVWCDVFVSPVRSEGRAITHFVAAISDVTDQVIMEAVLMRAKEAAEQASQAKSKFLSHVGHELRTPLNSIVGFAQLLESDPYAPLNEEQHERIEHILRSGWELRELIDDVLDLSRIEAGRLELKPEDVNVFDLVRECLEMIAAQATEKGLEVVNLSGECAQQMARVDVKRFKQVMLNLLSNAVKYNREGGRVTVSCHVSDDGVMHMAVSDTGIGIPPEKRDELFQYFSRLGAENSGIPGIGVGLALCRHLVDLMGGNITVESVPGQGSRFEIELPGTCCVPETV
jgi:PAS domain S-box-containing protein